MIRLEAVTQNYLAMAELFDDYGNVPAFRLHPPYQNIDHPIVKQFFDEDGYMTEDGITACTQVIAKRGPKFLPMCDAICMLVCENFARKKGCSNSTIYHWRGTHA